MSIMSTNPGRKRFDPLVVFGVPVMGGGLIPATGQPWYVDPKAAVFTPKRSFGTGRSEDKPLATLAAALEACNTGDRIYVHGGVNEPSLICSNLKFDVQVVGVGGLHHPDQPTSAYHPGSAMIRDTTDTGVNVTVRGRGWQFHNICFDAPASYAAVQLSRNALSGTSEYDASHAVFKNCRFLSGKYGIDDAGGANNVTVENCEFAGMTTCGIYGSSTAVANPRAWKILRCNFPNNVSGLGNATHIDLSLNESYIRGCLFGTVTSTGLYINLTGGNGNFVTENHFQGSYSTDDYVPGTGDYWMGNFAMDTAETEVEANGLTNTTPQA